MQQECAWKCTLVLQMVISFAPLLVKPNSSSLGVEEAPVRQCLPSERSISGDVNTSLSSMYSHLEFFRAIYLGVALIYIYLFMYSIA